MRIAFLSYEFPPDTGGGGIGTYLEQVSRILAAAGHNVEVFAGSNGGPSEHRPCERLLIRRVVCRDSIDFRNAVVSLFRVAHLSESFDVIEGCDFDASALEVKKAFPEIPYVVKLHTPRFVIDELQQGASPTYQRLRMWLGALRRGKLLKQERIRDGDNAKAEIECVRLAEEIASPSKAIADLICGWGGIDPGKISVFPYCYEAPEALLEIPEGGDFRCVTYLGRIEKRKGVEDLTNAIPLVLKRFPNIRFRFVGRSMIERKSGSSYDIELKRRLGKASASVEFTGPVPPAEVARALAVTDILVAPSHWESFGLVCCEGMAAGRAVIGSSEGGMAEILENGRCGILVPPCSPGQLAEAIIRLLAAPVERALLGAMARQRVCEVYCPDTVLPVQIASYEKAIRRLSSLS
jgi:glycogen(starch) synthase